MTNTLSEKYKITGSTRLVCLLGSPVSHSISPMMHNEAFRILGLDYVYLCFDVGTDKLAETVQGLRAMNATGFNCTMPNKNIMCTIADELSPAAKMIGAVNTVVIKDGCLIGHNTDGMGYMQAVRDAGHNIIGKKMTLLGAGGAATAICVQAALDGVAQIDMFSIKDEFWNRACKLCDTINTSTSCQMTLHDLSDKTDLANSIADSDILTNATSVGMSPNTDACIIEDSGMLRKNLIVSDIIYNPRQTKLLKMAQEQGCSCFNGLYMLLYQGAEAFKLWTGSDMPTDIIKDKYFND
ncbi:MAG: shikimate dehydrogenase [Eubacterium sp.]